MPGVLFVLGEVACEGVQHHRAVLVVAKLVLCAGCLFCLKSQRRVGAKLEQNWGCVSQCLVGEPKSVTAFNMRGLTFAARYASEKLLGLCFGKDGRGGQAVLSCQGI